MWFSNLICYRFKQDVSYTQEEFEKRNYKFFSEIDKNNDRYLSKLEMFKKRKKIKRIKKPKEFANFVYNKFIKNINTKYNPIIHYDSF